MNRVAVIERCKQLEHIFESGIENMPPPVGWNSGTDPFTGEYILYSDGEKFVKRSDVYGEFLDGN